MSLSKDEIKNLAKEMVVEIKATHHGFWIDPETHYNDHKDMREVIGSWKSAKGIFARAFIGLVVVGSIILAGIALMKGITAKG